MNNLSIVALIRIAIQHIYVLIITALVFATIAFSYCHFLATPAFSATGSVLVTNGAIIASDTSSSLTGSTVSGTDLTASLQLANTITDILKTNDIYADLSSVINNKYTYKELIDRSSVRRRNEDTLFIDITFKASTKNEAIMLVNEYLKLVPDHIMKFVPNSNSAVTTTADSAEMVFPRTVLTTFAAAVAGAAIAFVIVYIIALSNTTIKSPEDITDNYELTLIGNIPDFSAAQSSSYYKSYAYKSSNGNGEKYAGK